MNVKQKLAKALLKTFLNNTKRSRVFIHFNDKVAVCQNRIDRDWNLVGGGVKRNEELTQAALREIKEEIGLELISEKLKYLSDLEYSEDGIKFTICLFVAELNSAPPLKTKGFEIVNAEWVRVEDLLKRNCSPELKLMLNAYEINALSSPEKIRQLWYNERRV